MPNMDNSVQHELVDLQVEEPERTFEDACNEAEENGETEFSYNGSLYRWFSHREEWLRVNLIMNIEIDGEWYYDADDARNAGFVQCEYCGDWVCEDSYDAVFFTYYHHSHVFCSTDCAYSDGYEICNSCGDWYYGEDGYYINEEYYCDSCGANSTYCDCCGTRVWDEDYDFDNDCCDYCSEHNGGHELHQYSYREKPVFYGDTDGNYHPYMGVELETDNGRDRGAYVSKLAGLDLYERFWMTQDGSLCNGVEIASHPMTLDEHVSCGMWNDIRKTAVSSGFVSHNSGNCGLHVHINRDFFGKNETVQQVGGHKMMRIMQRFERQMLTFARRKDDHWCRFKTHYEFDEKKNPLVKVHGLFNKADLMMRENCHAQAVNFEHAHTFEIRIFRGTLKLETFYASLAFAEGIAKYCKTHGEATIESCTWYDLVDWILVDCNNITARACLRNYLESKGLSSTDSNMADALVSSYFNANNSDSVEVM